jgi:hypothetical protein
VWNIIISITGRCVLLNRYRYDIMGIHHHATTNYARFLIPHWGRGGYRNKYANAIEMILSISSSS